MPGIRRVNGTKLSRTKGRCQGHWGGSIKTGDECLLILKRNGDRRYDRHRLVVDAERPISPLLDRIDGRLNQQWMTCHGGHSFDFSIHSDLDGKHDDTGKLNCPGCVRVGGVDTSKQVHGGSIGGGANGSCGER